MQTDNERGNKMRRALREKIVCLWTLVLVPICSSSTIQAQQVSLQCNLDCPQLTYGKIRINKPLYATFSEDGKWLAIGSMDKSVSIFRSPNWTLHTKLQAHTHPVLAVRFSRDSKYLATGSADGSMILWNTANFSKIKTLKAHQGTINSIDFDISSRTIVSGGDDYYARVWDVSTGKLVVELPQQRSPVRSTVFLKDPHEVVVTTLSEESPQIRKVNIQTGVETQEEGRFHGIDEVTVLDSCGRAEGRNRFGYYEYGGRNSGRYATMLLPYLNKRVDNTPIYPRMPLYMLVGQLYDPTVDPLMDKLRGEPNRPKELSIRLVVLGKTVPVAIAPSLAEKNPFESQAEYESRTLRGRQAMLEHLKTNTPTPSCLSDIDR